MRLPRQWRRTLRRLRVSCLAISLVSLACPALALPAGQPTAQTTGLSKATIEITDAEGRRVDLAAPARRIIALAPHIVENLFAIGAGEQVVGAVQFSDFPEAARDLPRVGGVGTFSMEKLISLQPDLVILWGSGSPVGLRGALERLKIPYYVDEIRSLRELADSLHALGELTGQRLRAARMEARVAKQIAPPAPRESTREAKARPLPSVFLQIWDQPLQSIGGQHLLNEVIARCGGRSITDTSPGLAPLISIEAVLAENPRLIIVESPAQGEHWQRYPALQAVQRGQILVIHPDLLYRPTLRLLEGMRMICKRIESLA